MSIEKTESKAQLTAKGEGSHKEGKKSKKKRPKGWRNKKIPTEGFAEGDKVQLIYQQLGTNQAIDDHYTINRILSLEHAEIEHQCTGRKLTVRGDKLRHHNHQPP